MITKIVSITEQNKQVVQEFLDATHRGDVSVIDTLVVPHIVAHNFPGGKTPTNREEYKEFFRQWNRGLPQQEFTILTMLAEGNQVAVQFSINGRHDGELLGISATGQQISFTGLVLYRMKNGLIAETWLYPDAPTLLGQLGILS